MDEYLVIRADNTGPGTLNRDGTSSGPVIKVEVEELETEEVDDLKSDDAVVDVMLAMPIVLHEPFAGDDSQAVAASHGSGPRTTWGISVTGASSSPFNGEGVTVAVLDTGIDDSHAAFAGVTLERKNFTTESDDDLHGHGTHCAGTIFGRPVDDLRIGVAPGVNRALIGKVIGRGGTTASLVRAIQWAIEEGADVVSMSLGFDFPGMAARWAERMPAEFAMSRALQAYRQNVDLFSALGTLAKAMGAVDGSALIIAAAGNESRRNEDAGLTIDIAPPAAAQEIVSVGAVGTTDAGLVVAPFSNTGPDVCGPGMNVMSAKPGGGLQSMNGTSMATPHLAGLAALYAQRELDAAGSFTSAVLSARLVGMSTRDQFADYRRVDHGSGFAVAPSS